MSKSLSLGTRFAIAPRMLTSDHKACYNPYQFCPGSLSIAMDFMVELPEFNGFNALMVIVNKLGKLSRLVPCRAGEGQLTAPQIAKLFFENWVRFFGIPKAVFHDRDARFTAEFWKVL